MATLRHFADMIHLGEILLYTAIAAYFLGFFAFVELALLKLPT